MTEQDQDTEVFMSPRDVATGVDDASGSIGSAAEAAWDAASTATDWAPIGAEGPAHLPDADGGSPDPWGAPSAGESGGIIEAVEREAANRPAPDDTPPTGPMSDDQPDDGIPPDAEIFISQ